MYKIAFVILHFETLNDTEDCINSLIKQTYQNVEIIVVDNGSKKGKVDTIKKKYSNYQYIHFIESKRNLGFAKGNNLGYEYAKRNLKADFIVLSNNDLIFEQEEFARCLINNYTHKHFDIAGPRIISLIDGMNQNPVRRLFKNSSDTNRRLLKLYILYFLSFFSLDTVFRKGVSNSVKEYHMTKGQDFQLHGACLIFSPTYVERYEGLFAGTFMYGEEDILKLRAEIDELNLAYIVDAEVKHKEGSSTKNVFVQNREQRRFFYRWSIDSTRMLKKMYKDIESKQFKKE